MKLRDNYSRVTFLCRYFTFSQIISNDLHSQHFRVGIDVSEIVQISQVTCETDPAIFPEHFHGKN